MNNDLIEEAAENQWKNVHRTGVLGFIEGAKWMKERMYSEGDMIDYSNYVSAHNQSNKWELPLLPKEWFEKNKKK